MSAVALVQNRRAKWREIGRTGWTPVVIAEENGLVLPHAVCPVKTWTVVQLPITRRACLAERDGPLPKTS